MNEAQRKIIVKALYLVSVLGVLWTIWMVGEEGNNRGGKEKISCTGLKDEVIIHQVGKMKGTAMMVMAR